MQYVNNSQNTAQKSTNHWNILYIHIYTSYALFIGLYMPYKSIQKKKRVESTEPILTRPFNRSSRDHPDKIREAPTTFDAKRIGSQVMVSDQWLDTQEKVMTEVIESKFKQVKEFQDKLISIDTKTVTIVEAAYDDMWGAGLDRNGTLKTVMKAWSGKNGLCKLFMNTLKSKK